MADVKHTQGPWTHVGQGDITGIENDPANGCVGPVDVCCVYLRTVEGRSDANARLIAAAPDLLEAAKMVLAWYEAEDDHNGTSFYQRIDMCRESEMAIRAAIAKATGAARATEGGAT